MRGPLMISLAGCKPKSLAGCLQKCSLALMEARHRSPSQGHRVWTLSTPFRDERSRRRLPTASLTLRVLQTHNRAVILTWCGESHRGFIFRSWRKVWRWRQNKAESIPARRMAELLKWAGNVAAPARFLTLLVDHNIKNCFMRLMKGGWRQS